jgi:uncharacterized protein (TIGR03435 family)
MLLACCLGGAVSADPPPAQAKAEALTFDVASIRPTTDHSIFSPLRVWPGGRLAGRTTLENLIRFAYGLNTYERVVVGRDVSPLFAQWFEVNAKPSASAAPTGDGDVRSMTREMLAARFKLRVRSATVDQDVSVLLQNRRNVLGPGLRLLTEQCVDPPPEARPTDARFDEAYTRSCHLTIDGDRLRGTATLSEFARFLSAVAQRPIIDDTGLTGRYQIAMTFAAGTLIPQAKTTTDAAAFLDALRDQLGLRIRTEKRPVKSLVIEHLEPLIEN